MPDIWTKENLPTELWKSYRKKTVTKMLRISGPFSVYTREGKLTCQDGYLAVDSQGFPYPIDKEVQEETYEEV